MTITIIIETSDTETTDRLLERFPEKGAEFVTPDGVRVGLTGIEPPTKGIATEMIHLILEIPKELISAVAAAAVIDALHLHGGKSANTSLRISIGRNDQEARAEERTDMQAEGPEAVRILAELINNHRSDGHG